MGKKALALAATAVMGVSGVLAASPASANTTYSGAYAQWTGPLSCTGQVYNGSLPSGGAGGTLYVEVKAQEVRLSSTHFRTAYVRTRVVAQEKTYSGVWKSVASTRGFTGHLGPATNAGAYNVSRVNWGGDYSPTLHVHVTGYDDLFRAKVITKFFDDEGVMVKKLVTRQGQCQL
jgi:hypothetical protein